MADDAAAEAARAQAEARRKRILEKANKRLGMVSGEMAQDVEEKSASAANAARIRAARQRRRKKGAGPAKPAESTDNSEDGADAKSSEETQSPNNDDTTEAETANAKNEEEPKFVTEESSEKSDHQPNEPSASVEAVPSIGDDGTAGAASSTTNEPASKKKYVGVARMRRKMILKKRQEEESESKPESTTEAAAVVLPATVSAPVSTFPVYMYIFTVLLLFLAGLDVGLQQFHQDVTVHPNDVFSQHGAPFVHRNLWKVDETNSPSQLEELQKRTSDWNDADTPDEFVEDEDEYEPNIDPLFRVDLDELTKGSGILLQLARGAVAVHRFILRIVYEIPMGIFQTILGIPQTLINSPPILCIVALILRQVISKQVLRASLPSSESDDKSKETGGIDVLAMIKQTVKNFLSSAFPTAVSMYDAFTHIRSDMYIILCGVFFGLAWRHQQVLHTEGDRDEL